MGLDKLSVQKFLIIQHVVLNVPVKGMEDMILFIGSFHGSAEQSKIRKIIQSYPNEFNLCEVLCAIIFNVLQLNNKMFRPDGNLQNLQQQCFALKNVSHTCAVPWKVVLKPMGTMF